MIYEVVEDIEVYHDYYGKSYGTGTVRKGWKFELLREPTPQKKYYKLLQIDTKYPQLLYLRKSQFNKYLTEVK